MIAVAVAVVVVMVVKPPLSVLSPWNMVQYTVCAQMGPANWYTDGIGMREALVDLQLNQPF